MRVIAATRNNLQRAIKGRAALRRSVLALAAVGAEFPASTETGEHSAARPTFHHPHGFGEAGPALLTPFVVAARPRTTGRNMRELATWPSACSPLEISAMESDMLRRARELPSEGQR